MKQAIEQRPSDHELEEALRGTLGLEFTVLQRRPHAYQSSFPIEELDLQGADGQQTSLVFKDLATDHQIPEALLAKPAFLFDPMREIDVYEQVLGPAGIAASYYGHVVDRDLDRYWLFIERVNGTELHQFGQLEVWRAAAGWLATFHDRFSAFVPEIPASLIRHNREFYATWMERAFSFSAANEAMPPRLRQVRHQLNAIREPLIARLASMPQTLLHGEFYSTNVLIRCSGGHIDVVPVDWENAAAGPGLIDLAALIAGDWDDSDREAMVRAYYEALPLESRPEWLRLLEDLAWCRLQLAVQWLGWSSTWQPPPEKQHDWPGDILRLSYQLGF